MTTVPFLILLTLIEALFCLAALCAITWKRQWKDYAALGAYLATHGLSCSILVLSMHFDRHPLDPRIAYKIYFYTYWISFAAESILALLAVYSTFRLAMAPLKGLQQLGMLVFRWAASISLVVALTSALAPQTTGIKYLMAAISQIQRTQSIITLCLLVFICFAIRPMGIDYRNRIFGVSLGLGILATNNLVQAAWFVFNAGIYNFLSLLNCVVLCLSISIWTVYFILPEPKRRLVVLPTTSPFLRWNQISQALGDSPGFVAVGGFPSDLFAPAELEVMQRASRKVPIPISEASLPRSKSA